MPLKRPGQNGANVLSADRPLMGDPPPEVPRNPNKFDKRPWIRAVDDPGPAPATMIGPNGYTVLANSGDKSRGAYYTRASSLGGALEDTFNLNKWGKRVVAKGMAFNRSAQVEAKTCDVKDDRAQMDEIVERVFETGGGNDAARAGTAIHTICDGIDRGQEVPTDDIWDGCVAAYRQVIPRFTVHAIELFLVNDALKSSGTADRLVSPRWTMRPPWGPAVTPSDRLIWDLKTAQTADFFGCKFAVQMDVYEGGVPYAHERGRMEWPDGVAPRSDWALILHLPSGGDTAQLYWVDLTATVEFEAPKTLAEFALAVREVRKTKLFYPAELPVESPSGLNEVGFAAELRACKAPADVKAVVDRLRPLLSEAQLAKARALWAELAQGAGGVA